MKPKAKYQKSARAKAKTKAIALAKREAESAAAFTAANHTVDLERRVARMEEFLRDAQAHSSVNWTELAGVLDGEKRRIGDTNGVSAVG